MNVYDYIKNYAITHGIEDYTLKCKYVSKADVANVLQFSGGVAFFYRVFAEGEITDKNQLQKKFLEVDTPTDFWDLSPVAEVVDFGTLQKVETDFIFTADNTLKFNLFEGTTDAMFANVINFCALYMYMAPRRVTASNDGNNGNGKKNANDDNDIIIITD